MQPTPSDYERDLRADLELCERATKGPWESLLTSGSGRQVLSAPAAGADLAEFRSRAVSERQPGIDSDFCAASRLGWPAAIRRALAAESEAAALRERLAALESENRAWRQMSEDHARQQRQLGEMLGQAARNASDTRAEVEGLRERLAAHERHTPHADTSKSVAAQLARDLVLDEDEESRIQTEIYAYGLAVSRREAERVGRLRGMIRQFAESHQICIVCNYIPHLPDCDAIAAELEGRADV